MEEVKLRTLSVLVDNESGVLSQVSRLFSRKGFNVESLAVGTTDNPAISRMTIEVLANENQTDLMCNQLAKMVPVHSVKLLVYFSMRDIQLCSCFEKLCFFLSFSTAL